MRSRRGLRPWHPRGGRGRRRRAACARHPLRWCERLRRFRRSLSPCARAHAGGVARLGWGGRTRVAPGGRPGSAFEELSQRYRCAIERACRSIAGSDLEDCAQEVFVRVWRKAHLFDRGRGAPLRGY
ncbi:MAG: hypothetical protein HOQ28_17070 [Thermoleophilia bacterium]|nr:hypothetical protein [Thermoleophilia bacterium]